MTYRKNTPACIVLIEAAELGTDAIDRGTGMEAALKNALDAMTFAYKKLAASFESYPILTGIENGREQLLIDDLQISIHNLNSRWPSDSDVEAYLYEIVNDLHLWYEELQTFYLESDLVERLNIKLRGKTDDARKREWKELRETHINFPTDLMDHFEAWEEEAEWNGWDELQGGNCFDGERILTKKAI